MKYHTLIALLAASNVSSLKVNFVEQDVPTELSHESDAQLEMRANGESEEAIAAQGKTEKE